MMSWCPSCNKEIAGGKAFCAECGYSFLDSQSESEWQKTHPGNASGSCASDKNSVFELKPRVKKRHAIPERWTHKYFKRRVTVFAILALALIAYFAFGTIFNLIRQLLGY